MLKRKLGIIFATMLLFSLISYILIAAFGRRPAARYEEEKIIVTSFYPVYIITRNLTEGMEGVQTVNLTENQTGCLHDYQLTTKDMLLLETADLLVINGGDMELFITSAAEGLSGLTVIDSCEGISLLAGEAHEHEHESGEAGMEDDSAADTDTADASDAAAGIGEGSAADDSAADGMTHEEETAVNGHVWMDMERYEAQVHTIADGLCKALPEYEAQLRANEKAYTEQIEALRTEYARLSEKLSGLEVVTFHDAFAYLCDSFGIEIVHGIDLDADTALSAGEIAEITDEIRLHGIRYLFAEETTGAVAEQLAAETGCTVIYLDPITSGDSGTKAYLDAMRANLERLDGLAP